MHHHQAQSIPIMEDLNSVRKTVFNKLSITIDSEDQKTNIPNSMDCNLGRSVQIKCPISDLPLATNEA